MSRESGLKMKIFANFITYYMKFFICFQRYLTTLRKEKEAFEMLIKQKAVSKKNSALVFSVLDIFQIETVGQSHPDGISSQKH